MNTPASDKFAAVDLSTTFNTDRDELDDTLRLVRRGDQYYGDQVFQGVPFSLGQAGQPNVILLGESDVEVEIRVQQKASYVLFLHAVEQASARSMDGLPEFGGEGNELGTPVSDYVLEYDDGTYTTAPILRRFAIQQSRTGWGASSFAAVTDVAHAILPTHTQQLANGGPAAAYGQGETRVRSGRDWKSERLWIYALPNPESGKTIETIRCRRRDERSAIYAVTCTELAEHPLRPRVREKLRLKLPKGASLNALGELESVDIDLGVVISTQAALDYDRAAWTGDAPDVQPQQSSSEVVIEYAAHPQAKLYIETGGASQQVYELGSRPAGIAEIKPAWRPVRIRTIDKDSGQPVAVRLHLHGAEGEYLPPKGYHRKVNGNWFEDNYGEFVNGLNQYCYIPGECVADLPLGEVFIALSRGYEIAPVRTSVQIEPDTEELTFELERVLDWRPNGWVTADTHVHFLSPQTARLEGEAEGINVVNLLASQWGEMFSNVSDFDGATTIGAREFGGDGEFLVRVGTENRMQILGHISLLGYSGSMIHPLCSGGPSESALGDPQELTMAQWAQQCIDQNGLVVMPHGPRPQCERAADIVLGLIHAIEMMSFNPHNSQIDPYGIADWYRFLNLGYQVPVVGGTDKMSASSQLGGIRTYAHLGDEEFSYDNWMQAVRRGNTFVTVGPLIDFAVEGLVPGSTLEMVSDGMINVTWKVASVSLPIDQVEVIAGGLIADSASFDKTLTAEGSCEIPVSSSTWVALRVRGSYRGNDGDIAAHSSAVQVRVAGAELFSAPDATAVLNQIEGAMAYVDTLAPRPEATRYKQLRVTLESAHRRLHERMHQQGIYHDHALHSDEHPHEH